MLVDREREVDELNALLKKPSARLVAVSGRRRLGKTTLLMHWARTSNHPFLYWVASHFPSLALLGQFSREVWRLGNPGKHTPGSFSYDSWQVVGGRRAPLRAHGRAAASTAASL